MQLQAALKIVRFIAQHPLARKNRVLAFSRFFSWQIRQRVRPRPEKVRFVEDSVMIVEKGMEGATGNIYTGLLEFEDMAFLLHLLRPGDTFIDIGANVGAYTILAAKNVGADVVAVEPIPSTFTRLERNVDANLAREKVELKRYGVGDNDSTLRFTEAMDSVNHVIAENERTDGVGIVEVPVRTLDELLEGRQPVLFKIDVEGYEWPALIGAKSMLGLASLKAIIIELNGSGRRYGYDDDKIHELLISYGFSPYSYKPFTRELKRETGYGEHNTIYLKDADWSLARVKMAKKYNILNVAV
jgi:FkbM family methyltransferase